MQKKTTVNKAVPTMISRVSSGAVISTAISTVDDRPRLAYIHCRYNVRSGLAIVCPVTSRVKGYPFETPLPDGLPISGVALADHARSLDWNARHAELICQLLAEVVQDVAAKIIALVAED